MIQKAWPVSCASSNKWCGLTDTTSSKLRNGSKENAISVMLVLQKLGTSAATVFGSAIPDFLAVRSNQLYILMD
jgi:hypothetical protein